MENNEKKNTMAKLWPLWLIIIAIVAVVLLNAYRSGSSQPNAVDQLSQTGEELSGKALSLVSSDQLFMAQWFGKKSPDFSVTTLDGETVTLSSLAGKEVMFVFWATWCPPCRAEIPHIIELRNHFGKDKLAIIGYSSEKADTVREFAKKKEMNYTIATGHPSQLPEPYSRVTALPSIFFVDSEGKFKLAVQGGLSYEQMKGIVEAE
jgi:peroxiredoxin